MAKRSTRAVLWIFLGLILVAGGYFLGRQSQGLKFFGKKQPGPSLSQPSSPSAGHPALSIPPGLSDFEKKVMLVANQAMPSIVNIYTEKKVQVRVQDNPFAPFLNDPFFRRFFGNPFPQSRPRQQIQTALGSGVIVSADGFILTNNHVIADADLIKISLADKRSYDARVVGKDPKTDLALLKINADGLPALKLGDSDKIEIGQFVLAFGNPFGLSGTVTSGIVSAKGRANLRIADYEDFIQTDAAINPGNSGGALVNLEGELVGINTAIFSQSGGSLGIGFAIPSNMARAVMESLAKYGKVVRGYLGVSIQELTPELKKSFKYEGEGVLVAEVMAGSPAERAGLKPGDIIAEYRGHKVSSTSEFKNLVGETAPGEKVEMKAFRNGKLENISAQVVELKDEQEPTRPGTSRPSSFGLLVQELTPELRSQLGVGKNLEGVVVAAVEPGSRADASGLKAGDIILRVNQTMVRNTSDFARAMESVGDEQVLFWIFRDSRTLFVVVPPLNAAEEQEPPPEP